MDVSKSSSKSIQSDARRSGAAAPRKPVSASALAAGVAKVAETVSGGEDRLSDADFTRVSELVGRLTGIVIKSHKREMIQSRLSRRLRALGMTSYSDYLDLVASPAGAEEIGEMVNAVTTNLTSFFRESHHFDHLQSEIVEPMVAQGASRMRIWSSACSSGEEPYSIMMSALDAGAAKISDFKLLATDLDTAILARAARGAYPEDRIKPIPQKLTASALTRQPDGGYVFRDAVKKHITFKQLNLLHDWPMRGPFDVIFCRNVLIYFDAETKASIVDRMAQLLRPNGALYLGHSESLVTGHPHLISEGRTIYRRVP